MLYCLGKSTLSAGNNLFSLIIHAVIYIVIVIFATPSCQKNTNLTKKSFSCFRKHAAQEKRKKHASPVTASLFGSNKCVPDLGDPEIIIGQDRINPHFQIVPRLFRIITEKDVAQNSVGMRPVNHFLIEIRLV